MFNRKVLLTFDLEEFDIPNEYGSNISWEEQIKVGKSGMTALNALLSQHKIPVTIFTTAAYALENKDQVKALAQSHEIASHTFYHSHFVNEDLAKSKKTLEAIIETAVTGLRMPRLKPIDMTLVKAAGYHYDSSINPTYLPGKYNNRHLPKTLYLQDDVLRMPCSVTPNLRIPLFWLSFKNFPYSIYKTLAVQSIKKYGYLNLYFHPWEFTDITGYKLPFYIKKHSGNYLLDKLDRLIADLKLEGSFETMTQFLQKEIAVKL